jgi:hypothetical protein
VSEFIVVPDTFLRYVTEFRRIPIPVDTDIKTLRAMIETVCLEVSLGAKEAQPDLEPHRVRGYARARREVPRDRRQLWSR